VSRAMRAPLPVTNPVNVNAPRALELLWLDDASRLNSPPSLS
jgi:hypothetical protein